MLHGHLAASIDRDDGAPDAQRFAAQTMTFLAVEGGIAQRRDTSNPYGCTATQSRCPDAQFRGVAVCKHRAAALLLDVAESL